MTANPRDTRTLLRLTIWSGVAAVLLPLPAWGTPPVKVKSAGLHTAKQVARSNWMYRSTRNILHDSQDRLACTTSINSVRLGFPYRSQPLRLCLRQRKNDGLTVFVHFITSAQFYCLGEDGCEVQVRIDSAPVEPVSAGTPDDGSDDTLFLDGEQELVAKIRTAHRLLIDVPLFQAGNQTVTFNVTGLKWPEEQEALESTP